MFFLGLGSRKAENDSELLTTVVSYGTAGAPKTCQVVLLILSKQPKRNFKNVLIINNNALSDIQNSPYFYCEKSTVNSQFFHSQVRCSGRGCVLRAKSGCMVGQVICNKRLK